jgi:hypothetical protein
MPGSHFAIARAKRWLFTLGATLALVSQLGVLAAQIGEIWQGQSTASHVEAQGTSRHYAHNEATCPACQARSMTGVTSRDATPALLLSSPRATPVVALQPTPASRTPAHTQSRAPPTLA